MYSEFYEKHKAEREYIKETYPYLEPCVNCVYWRNLNGTDFTSKSRFAVDSIGNVPACHYSLYHEELKDDDNFLCDGNCKHFRERTKKTKIEINALNKKRLAKFSVVNYDDENIL